jgi:DNA (cytosine-5)-methyltransferase 1
MPLTSVELCAGAGGQALGLEAAGFQHLALVEVDQHACETLRHNRPKWNVVEDYLENFDIATCGKPDLLAAGVPCPPFSMAGKQLGSDDERDLFPSALELVEQAEPRAVLFENVRGLLASAFDNYRDQLTKRLESLGYTVFWSLLNASDYGVPQLRPRTVVVAVEADHAERFAWPDPSNAPTPTVGEALYPLMASRGWKGADAWRERANRIAPTLVGGSKKHGGPDLGPTRAKRAWADLGVNAHTLADEPPSSDFEGVPRLTVPMTAILQGFPTDWRFSGRKTAAYRQVGNAFPPPVAQAVASSIALALAGARKSEPALAA